MSVRPNIVVEQGATFTLNATWQAADGTPVDLTGYSARMQARQTYASTTAVLNLTNAGGNITLGGTAGTVVVTVSATATAALTAPWSGVYDLELASAGGVVTRLLEGSLRVTPEVTR
jgi:hypothetical protein